MRVCGQLFSSALLDQIKGVLTEEPVLSRRALSRQVCTWLNWRSSRGHWQEGSARKALAILHRRGALTLPNVEGKSHFPGFPKKPHRIESAMDTPVFQGSLDELGSVEIVPITSRYCKAASVWNVLLDRYHPLGKKALCGAQIRYLIKSSRYGSIGAMAFSSAPWALHARDRFIGWSEAARIANLRFLVTQNRFLIVPTVQVKNLASYVLAQVLARLPDDWEARYHVRPVLVETFVDPTRFKGTCYKASNWVEVGQTAGRRNGGPKRIFLYPLYPSWQTTLCEAPSIGLGQGRRENPPAHWMDEEFGTIRLYDRRLKERLCTVAQDFYNHPQASIPYACASKARTLGAYRLFKNKNITMDVLLTPHTEATIERIRSYPVVLAPQDTTTLNYTRHAETEGLGPIHHTDHNAVGLILHDTIAFTEEGTPLGIVDAQCWARDPQERGKRHSRHERPIEQKESMKWLRSFRKVAEVQKLCPQTQLVSIGDREADIYDLFHEAGQHVGGPKLLVRAEKSRNRKVEQEHLWTFMAQQACAGILKIHVPRHKGQKAREAYVAVRFSRVALSPPKRNSAPPISVWAVYLVESECEEGVVPIEWMLLTTAAVNTFEEAQKRVEWYSGRWGIEVYHRTLKTGCRIEDRQLGTADRLEACLGVDMVVAWRIYHLTMLGREVPDHPCTLFFEEVEWKALWCYAMRTPEPPQEPPTLKQAIRMLGKIGGHLGRKGDGMPGTVCIWRGWERLDVAVEMYAIFKHLPLPQKYPFPSEPLLPLNRSP